MVPWWVIGDRCFIHNTDGQRVFLDTEELHMSCHMLEHGVWEPHVRKIIEYSLSKGDTYIDVGANIGLHALYAASLVGENGIIIAHEPNDRIFNILKMNIEANGFWTRSHLSQKAISNFEGTTKFYAYDGHASMSGFMNEHTDFSVGKRECTVNVTTVDNISASNVGLLKIDVEGFEYDVLLGAQKTIAMNPEITIILEFEPQSIAERRGKDAILNTINLFENFNMYISKYMRPLEKIESNRRRELEKIDGCDLVVTKRSHLDCLVGKEVELERKISDNISANEKELLHYKKAYVEAIAVQEELKKRIKFLENR